MKFRQTHINKFSGGLLLTSVSVGLNAQTAEAPKHNKSSETPNVIFILADDLGTINPNSYLTSAVTVGKSVSQPLAYFSATSPSSHYINYSVTSTIS